MRGSGLWLAIALNGAAGTAVAATAQRQRFLVNAVQPDAVRLAPPLILTEQEADSFIAALPAILDAASVVLAGQEDVVTSRRGSVRHFLRDDDLSPAEQAEVLALAARLKSDRCRRQPLAGPRTVAVLFDKPSLRTRVSFAIGIAELGGYPLIIDAQATHAGRGEPVEDMTRVLASQVAAIVWRTFGQDRVDADGGEQQCPGDQRADRRVPPVPGPGRPADDPGRLRQAGGLHAHLPRRRRVATWRTPTCSAAPPPACTCGSARRRSYWPAADVLAAAAAIAGRTGGSVSVSADPQDACKGVDVLATDVWTSMGHEGQEDARIAAMAGYGLDAAKLALASPACRVLHCLPAHRGQEIAADGHRRPGQPGLRAGREPAARAEGAAVLSAGVRRQPVLSQPVSAAVLAVPAPERQVRMNTSPLTKAARHAQIASILGQKSAPVRSQEELAERLGERGVRVTQATLSRDLEELGAVRLRGPDGALVYALPGEPGPGGLAAASAPCWPAARSRRRPRTRPPG